MKTMIPVRAFTLHPLTGALLCACALAASGARAQSLDYGSLQALFEEPVTSSVTGSPQRAGDVPATMVIVTAEDIRRSGARDVPGVLQNVTGLDLMQWTHSASDLSIRGYNKAFSPRLLVLVNGRQVYADHYGYMSWSSLPVQLQEIRQIEVVKGPNSALFGFNAVGGVINIITYSPRHDALNFAQLRGGTQDFREFSAAATFPVLGGGLRVSGGSRRNDDFSTPIHPLNEGARRGDRRETLRFDLHLPVGDNGELEIEASQSLSEQADVVPIYLPYHEQMRVDSVKAVFTQDGPLGLVQGSVYANWVYNDAFPRNAGDGPLHQPFLTFENRVLVAQLQDTFKLGSAHTLRVSGEYRENTMDTTPTAGARVYYDVLSSGAMWQWQLSPSLSLTNAVRYDYLDLGRKGGMPAYLDMSNADWNRSLGATSFNSGLVWDAGNAGLFRLTASRGAQLPSLFNLGGQLLGFPVLPQFARFFPYPEMYFTGRPDLEPSVVSNMELAWERSFASLGMDVEIALYKGKTEGVLADSGHTDFAKAILGGPANIGDSRTQGAELTLRGVLPGQWRWSLGYLHQDLDDDFEARYPTRFTWTNFEATTPRHSGKASLGWSGRAWEADLFLRYQSHTQAIWAPANFFGTFELLSPVGSYVNMDARVAYRFGSGFTLSLAGQNLLEKEQRQTGGPEVERSVTGSVTVDF